MDDIREGMNMDVSFCSVRMSDGQVVILTLSDGREREEAAEEGGELLEICGTKEAALRSCQAHL